MSYLSDRLCRTVFTPGQIAVMQSSIIAYMATSNCVSQTITTCLGPPGLQPGAMPWYNQDAILLTGTVNNGDNETYYVADKVHLSSPTTSHTVRSGSNLFVQAHNEILLDKNFKSEVNAPMILQTGTITDCSFTYNGSNARSANEVLANIDMEMVTSVVDILRSTTAGGAHLIQEEFEEDINIESQVITAYPNPGNEVFNLRFHAKMESKVFVEIYDTYGKLLVQNSLFIESSGRQDIGVDISALPSGFFSYLLSIDGALYKGKLVK